MSNKFFCQKAKEIKSIFNELEITEVKILIEPNEDVNLYINFGDNVKDAANKKAKLRKKLLLLANASNQILNIGCFYLSELNHTSYNKFEPKTYDVFLKENLLQAIKDGQIELAKNIINSGIDINFQERENRQTLLHIALGQFMRLINTFNKHDNTNDKEEFTLSKIKNNLAVIQFLLTNHININILNSSNQDALTAALELLEMKSFSQENTNNSQAQKIMSEVIFLLEKNGCSINKEIFFQKGYQNVLKSDITNNELKKYNVTSFQSNFFSNSSSARSEQDIEKLEKNNIISPTDKELIKDYLLKDSYIWSLVVSNPKVLSALEAEIPQIVKSNS